jgi:hypothetical protein
MLHDKKQLPILRFMKTFHDDKDVHFDYEKFILEKSLSPYIYENEVMAKFLYRLQPMMALFFDQFNLIKNWKNYMVSKYHYKQKG